MARTLAAHRANPDIDFIVCFFHHCAYSTTAAHASDGGVRGGLVPTLFDRHQVDLVLQGHNHVFERTDPIRANRPTTAAADNAVVYPESDGTVYYTVGCGGRPRYAFQPGERESYRGNELADTFVPNSYVWTAQGDKHEEAVGWSRVRFANYAFIRVDVRPGTLIERNGCGGRRRIRSGIRQTHLSPPGARLRLKAGSSDGYSATTRLAVAAACSEQNRPTAPANASGAPSLAVIPVPDHTVGSPMRGRRFSLAHCANGTDNAAWKPYSYDRGVARSRITCSSVHPDGH